jgi:hypothetical protein
MIQQFLSARFVPRSRSTDSTPVLAGTSERSPSHSLACRLVQMMLALYLIPAILIVFLVGVLGIVVVGAARVLARLQDTPTS